jgi:hypothetical protein
VTSSLDRQRASEPLIVHCIRLEPRLSEQGSVLGRKVLVDFRSPHQQPQRNAKSAHLCATSSKFLEQPDVAVVCLGPIGQVFAIGRWSGKDHPLAMPVP